MSIRITKSRHDTLVMSLSELARRLNLPASRIRKAVAEENLQPSGEIGHNTLVTITEHDLETLESLFNASGA
jgi:hypothetical protein